MFLLLFSSALQSLVKLARLNGTRPPQEPLALPQPQPAAGSGGAAAPAPQKQGLAAALRDKHIARRFFILTYAFLVMCMVSALLGLSKSSYIATAFSQHVCWPTLAKQQF